MESANVSTVYAMTLCWWLKVSNFKDDDDQMF